MRARRLRPPRRRLLLPALIVAATAALVAQGVTRLDNDPAARPAHRAAVAAARVPTPPQRAHSHRVVRAITHAETTAPILTIAELRAAHLTPSGPLVPIGPPIPGRGYEAQRVAYRSQGLRVTATVLRPDSPGRHRLVIALHGFALASNYSDGADAMVLGIPLARHGILVGIPDYRGLGGGDADPRTEQLPMANAIDALNLLDLLLEDPEVDPTHVGIIGHSMGGNIGEILLAAHPGIRTAVLDAASESVDSVLYARRPFYFHGRPGIGTPAQNPALFTAMSPGLNLGPLHCTVLLEHGTADPVVPWQASVVADHELSAAGARVELRMVEGGTHDLDTPQWSPALTRGTEFMLASL